MGIIIYGETELNHLKAVDEKLKEIINSFGMLKRKTNTNLFDALIKSIISQQISTKAATTVTNRLIALVSNLTPENLLNLDDKDIQACGISFKKVSYLKGIAASFKNNEISFEHLNSLSDNKIIEELTKIKGVGPWTAQMLLIHTFLRPDVLTYDDLGLRGGMKILHGLEQITLEHFSKYKELYSPYGTTAAIYLWELYSRNSK